MKSETEDLLVWAGRVLDAIFFFVSFGFVYTSFSFGMSYILGELKDPTSTYSSEYQYSTYSLEDCFSLVSWDTSTLELGVFHLLVFWDFIAVCSGRMPRRAEKWLFRNWKDTK